MITTVGSFGCEEPHEAARQTVQALLRRGLTNNLNRSRSEEQSIRRSRRYRLCRKGQPAVSLWLSCLDKSRLRERHCWSMTRLNISYKRPSFQKCSRYSQRPGQWESCSQKVAQSHKCLYAWSGLLQQRSTEVVELILRHQTFQEIRNLDEQLPQ